MRIPEEVFKFLKKIAKNNNKEWFLEHKSTFEDRHKEFKGFLALVNAELIKTDEIESHRAYRIYRDVRFSKDKTPYKCHFSGFYKRGSAEKRGGYFVHIQPGNSYVGGGFYGPNKEDLLRIRQEFSADPKEIREVLGNEEFKKTFGVLRGEEVKTAPRGFEIKDPAIDLIRKKQFYVMREFTDEEVLSGDFLKQVNHSFKIIRPYFDYMSSVLTTDLNGESIL
tara:strand:+ start:9065 stop:9733 length:669 start_codon:yes stop_codon:yes gene_type:complete